MALGGYAHRVARIDLTSGSIRHEDIPEEWARKYIGARGLGVRYCLENGPKVDPLSPDNLLCILNGPLTGSRANMSGRLAFVTKSPLTGTVTDSHMGGWSAARLRWAGFDGLLLKGKAKSPVYLYIEDGKVEIRDASDLWGKNIHETIRILKQRHGDKDVSVMAIGPAGERLVRLGAWLNENDRAAGRGGTGAVGGSKNLKAIVVRAKTTYSDAARPEEFKEAVKAGLNAIKDEKNITSPKKGGLSVLGTNSLMNVTNTIGALPTRNSKFTSFGDRGEKISGEFIKEHYLVENPTCHACPVACKKEVEITSGPYKVHMESFEYEPAWSLGAHCDNDNAESIAFMIDQCNDYGMDAIEMGNCLATYMEVCENGWADKDSLKWGDHAKMVELVRKTAFREGVGNVLAEGVARIAAHFGRPEIGLAVRGQSIPAYDPRGLKGMGIAYATSNRGACHLRGYTPAVELGLVGQPLDPLAWEGKAEVCKLLQDLHAFSDSLDLCKFSAFAQGAGEYAAQYASMVGLDKFGPDDVLRTGERIYNLERYFNQLAGEPEGADKLPPRFLKEPSTMKGSQGQVCELDKMLPRYYEIRGWRNGHVPEAKLQELGIV